MSYQSEVLADSPVGYWRLGETSGTTAVDTSTSGNDGIYTNVTIDQPGLVYGDPNKAVLCNGTSSRVVIGNPAELQITGAITLEAIVSLDAIPTTGQNFTIIAKGYDGSNEGYALRIMFSAGAPKLNVVSYSSSANHECFYDISSWSVDEPHYIAGLHNGSAWKLYVDGEAVATATDATGAVATTKDVLIGADDVSGLTNYFPGIIDEVAIYATALSASRIEAHASAAGYIPAVSIVSATVPDTGAKVNVVIADSAAVTPATAAFIVRVNGVRMDVTIVTGSGTNWSLHLGSRWILDGQTVTVAGVTQSPAITATNDSEITVGRVKYVGRRFGIFICYSIITYTQVEIGDGTEDVNDFAPTDLDVDQWLDGVEAAGATYAVFTVKACDGFVMWDSATTAHGINATTWFAGPDGVDIVEQFCTKCRERGIAPVLYFSVWDRNWEAAHPGFTGTEYANHTNAQLSELLTKYGSISAMWFDAWGWVITPPPGWDIGYDLIPYATLSDHIKSLQPNCLVLDNSHALTGSPSEILEREVASDGDPAVDNEWPSEQCHTPRASEYWYWKTGSSTIESADQILAQMDLLNARRCAYLINFPVNTDGKIDETDMFIMSKMGISELQDIRPSEGEAFTITINATVT